MGSHEQTSAVVPYAFNLWSAPCKSMPLPTTAKPTYTYNDSLKTDHLRNTYWLTKRPTTTLKTFKHIQTNYTIYTLCMYILIYTIICLQIKQSPHPTPCTPTKPRGDRNCSSRASGSLFLQEPHGFLFWGPQSWERLNICWFDICVSNILTYS